MGRFRPLHWGLIWILLKFEQATMAKKNGIPQETKDDPLKVFNSKLNALKMDDKKHEVDDNSTGMAAGLKYASEFSAAVLVGVFFGYIADKFIGTTPWGLLAGLVFGFGAGVLNVVRAAKEGMDGT